MKTRTFSFIIQLHLFSSVNIFIDSTGIILYEHNVKNILKSSESNPINYLQKA